MLNLPVTGVCSTFQNLNFEGIYAMKQLLLTAVLSGCVAIGAHAAMVTGVDINAKVSANRVCNTATCTMPVKGAYKFNAIVALTNSERDALDANSTILVMYDGAINVNVRLGDDPKFLTGSTSAKFITKTALAGIPESELNQNITLDWSTGEMRILVASKFTALIGSNVVHPLESFAGVNMNEEEKGTKSHGGYPQTLTVEAKDGAAASIFQQQVLVKANRTDNIKRADNVDGSGFEKIKAGIQSVSFENLP